MMLEQTLIVWKLTRDDASYDFPHFISDVVLSSDGNYAPSCSWDKTFFLWDLAAGKSTRRFEDHTKDVLSVAFSVDNRQIVFGSRDKTIKLCITLAECKYTFQEDGTPGEDRIVEDRPFGPQRLPQLVLAVCRLRTVDQNVGPEPELKPSKANLPQCLSLAWSAEGQTLYAGYSVNIIRGHQSSPEQEERRGFFIQLDKAADPFSPFKKVTRGLNLADRWIDATGCNNCNDGLTVTRGSRPLQCVAEWLRCPLCMRMILGSIPICCNLPLDEEVKSGTVLKGSFKNFKHKPFINDKCIRCGEEYHQKQHGIIRLLFGYQQIGNFMSLKDI
ncbi:receptor for activated protein kinase C [Culex quinquefasciatus]|uniref:Small ribosomal subunit protein RACK1 n=1 Tax=Culex quinquefasciatus TaxID=7176 RepID=B0WKD8_CULQU|nr:receptor for activated protein kinase C [Culex quinquefasciatus]|eukprot:XP_001849172.1 receptor for activated protein kinase C [Culex quinquefasciatus]